MTNIVDKEDEKIARDHFNVQEDDLPALFLTNNNVHKGLMKKYIYMGDVRQLTQEEFEQIAKSPLKFKDDMTSASGDLMTPFFMS